MIKDKEKFNLDKVIQQLKHYLPEQAPLKDFIHHNTLHAFQNVSFHEALFKANKIFGYKTYLRFQEYRDLFERKQISKEILERIIEDKFLSKSSGKIHDQKVNWIKELFQAEELNYALPRIGTLRNHWKEKYLLDLDVLVHPFLFRLISCYLDQGVAIWNFPIDNNNFFKSIQDLEKNSLLGIFKTVRAKKMLLAPKLEIEDLLKILVGDERLYEHYLFDQQFAHPGWSGIVSVVENNPSSLLDARSISLIDLIKIELLLEIDALDNHFGEVWAPLATKIKNFPVDLFFEVKKTKNDLLKEIWQEAFEWTYYDQVLSVLKQSKKPRTVLSSKKFQAIFCIDDRECSIRRYIEELEPNSETFGTAGHFNVEFYFQPENGKFLTKVCPVTITPTILIQEFENSNKKKKDFHFNKLSNSLVIGWLLTHTIGIWSGIRMALSIFKPSLNAATSASTLHMDANSYLTIENYNNKMVDGLQLGFTIPQMADRVEGLLKSIGMVNDFAPLIYVIGHGSTSVNNTHYAGYDCGACSGRPGSVNARVFAYMANKKEVRNLLRARGISIPNETNFIGALHDTSRDELFFFDTNLLSELNKKEHASNVLSFNLALDKNAKERSRRFDSIDSKNTFWKIHQAIKKRSVSLFEPRPELNHATNALAIVGRRSFSQHVFLDRRSFLNSYDYTVDPEGKYLLNILNAVAPVCGGINLEYYFSRVDNNNLGAGSKLPHNVMGLVGIANGTEGDLRTGLPKQMIEVHDPIRLMVIVEHFPEVVLKTILKNTATYNWFENDWIKLVACNPESNVFFVFRNGIFEPYEIIQKNTKSVKDLTSLFESSNGNLPVFNLKSSI